MRYVPFVGLDNTGTSPSSTKEIWEIAAVWDTLKTRIIGLYSRRSELVGLLPFCLSLGGAFLVSRKIRLWRCAVNTITQYHSEEVVFFVPICDSHGEVVAADRLIDSPGR